MLAQTSHDALLRSNLNWMLAAVLQLSVVRSILFFVTLVLWTDEQYEQYADVRRHTHPPAPHTPMKSLTWIHQHST